MSTKTKIDSRRRVALLATYEAEELLDLLMAPQAEDRRYALRGMLHRLHMLNSIAMEVLSSGDMEHDADGALRAMLTPS
jgi:hypothetical protein